MHKLWHFRLCPLSRSIRLALSEGGIAFTLIEERPWEWRAEFLALNPAGELPVLELTEGPVLSGAYSISEFIAEEMSQHPQEQPSWAPALPLFPGTREDRAEVRRLVDWFSGKMHREVTRELLHEKIYARAVPRAVDGASHVPDADVLGRPFHETITTQRFMLT